MQRLEAKTMLASPYVPMREVSVYPTVPPVPCVEYLSEHYQYNPELGKGNQAAIVIKRLDQDRRDEKTRQRRAESSLLGGSFVRGSREHSCYKDGKVIVTDLDHDYLDLNTASWQFDAKQPTGIAVASNKMVVAEGSRLTIITDRDPKSVQHIDSPWFARMHTVEFSPDGKKLLTVASSWDTILEVNLETSEITELRLTDLGFNQTQFGAKIVRRELTASELESGQYVSASRPQDFKGMGLPTALTPVHLNGVHYDYDSEHLIATAFHQGQAWRINPYTGEVTVILEGLGHPHGFMKDPLYGYICTDTEGEAIYFLSRNFEVKQIVSTAGVSPKVASAAQESWVQNCDKVAGVYCAIDMPRRSLLLFDPSKKQYRRMSFDPSWAVQTVSDIN